jgi:hypothetical protein
LTPPLWFVATRGSLNASWPTKLVEPTTSMQN